MLKFLMSAALTVALSFLPEVGFSFPRRVIIINNSPTVIVPPAGNYGTVIVNPTSPYRTGIIDPFNNYNTTIVSPSSSYRTGIIDPFNNYNTTIVSPSRLYRTGIINPINNYGTVIVNPVNVNPIQQPSCGSVIMGSSIASPVPVNSSTGLSCR